MLMKVQYIQNIILFFFQFVQYFTSNLNYYVDKKHIE